jgi:hypothetical protein
VFLQPTEKYLNAQEPETGYSPALRALGVGAFGTAAYQAHKYALRTKPGYAQKLYQYALNFENASPWKMGRTFGLSERFSSHLIDAVDVPYDRLVRSGGLTPEGAHYSRLLGDKVDIFTRGEGLSFRRTALDNPYLSLVGQEDLQVRFTRWGRLGGSSGRYGMDLNPKQIDMDWSGEWWKPENLWDNFQGIRESQMPRNYRTRTRVRTGDMNLRVQPYQAKHIGSTAEQLKSTQSRVGRFFFELFERPQRLMADIGVGLTAGSYNKIAHIPFVGEGGMINQVLGKRVLPAALAITALGYADYLTGHVVSNTVASIPFRANVLRGDVTDMVPGARQVTDFYADTVPGAQYGPLALPAAGLFAGALFHYQKVLRGKYSPRTRELGGALFQGVGRNKGYKITDLWKPAELKRLFTGKGRYPAKGLLVGLAAVLPFLPGMLGSRKTGNELRDIYSGKEPVPIRAGRWWDLGSTPYEGGRIKEYRPHWFQLFRTRAERVSLYGTEKEYWGHHPLLHPFRYLRDPYYLEKKHYADRPYPVASPAFSNVPLIGPLLAATLGKVVKPPVRMHGDTWSGEEYSLYSTRLEPKEGGLDEPAPQSEFGLVSALKAEVEQFSEWIGLPGFLGHSAYDALFPDYDMGKDVYFQGSRQMTNISRRYYERELGAGMGPGPAGEGLFGYSEPLRRFIQREDGIAQANEIPNTMPSWLPGDDYFINFRVGDPYVKIGDGFARLPGDGFEALHPEVKGLSSEEYPDMVKFGILADVAPYSREFASLQSYLGKATSKDTEARIEYEKIMDRVTQMKESVIRTDERRFTADTDTVEGTISRATPYGIELENMPGRTFQLSSLGMSASDMSALVLGEQNDLNKSQVAQSVEIKQQALMSYLEGLQGQQARLTVPKGAAEYGEKIRAVVEVGGRNINTALIADNMALYRRDKGGPESQAMFSSFGKAIGALGEALSFTGDQDRFNPLRYVPTPGHTKLWQQRTALSQYESQEVIGTRMRRWHRPIHDFLGPYVRGMVDRLTGKKIIPEDVQHRRDLNTLSDMLQYLRSMHQASVTEEGAGKYTNQANRTAVGANLFGSPTFVASTLPDREAAYFRRFLNETDPEKRREILEVVSPEMARALAAQWVAQEARIAQAERGSSPELGEGGRLYSEEGKAEYAKAKTQLGYGDYMRSKEIAGFFDRTGFSLPDAESSLWDEVVDYDDVKLKLLQYEGYDMHDFNIFEDRAALLWRKPWLDGAVRELTSGNNKSVENLRRSVEQIMIAARNRNPNARVIGNSSHRAMGNVRVDVEDDDHEEVIRDMRRNPERYLD